LLTVVNFYLFNCHSLLGQQRECSLGGGYSSKETHRSA